jgi:hypothetical protein
VVPAGEIPNWAAMIEEARRERMMLGTVLSETRLLSSSGNNINLACPDDFHITQLQRNREYLSELAERVLGAKVRFEGILAASSASVAGRVAPGQQGGAGSAPAGGRGGAIEAGGTGRAAGTSSATSTSADGSSNGNSGGGTGGRDELRAHPVVQALMREFGAEEID